MKRIGRWVLILVGAVLFWAAVSENPAVWPVRNTLEYFAARAWWNAVGLPAPLPPGELAGRIRAADGRPIENATVILAEWDGATHTARTDAGGKYLMQGIPAGFYRVAVTAADYEPRQSGGLLRGTDIRPGRRMEADFTLQRAKTGPVCPLATPMRSDPRWLACSSPVAGEARRETLVFSASGLRETVLFYRPAAAADRDLPVLLTVYPGPVDTWECVSIGLAQAGYAVVAVGPAYGMDLTPDVDTLERLVALVKSGGLPGADPARVAALGGSYSALLLELLILRDPGLDALVLLGPPTDMFDFRRRFEREGFVPPFGLDRALIALGLPNRDPLRYLRHSAVYHVRPGLPATILFHSYQDGIVPYQQSGLLAESLRGQGVEAELHLFDGASHYLLEDGEASHAIYRQTLDFLRRHGMAPYPGKER